MRGSPLIALRVPAARLVHELAQRNRSPARLGAQPLSVSRQQRDFARNHAEFRATAASGRRAVECPPT
jgi:hypothetical protein